ncbi:TRAF3-interacting protein 1 isoform X5 [Marmota marmota marmota]|uniref:TRAF3-interacting protein 1 isoform X5 n=1 Tax=Marmota marmota marmota TaxID=9994 RepID=UPI0020921653|nr:TRAF3-interacting protein 1 isoform X5 [Marmota marmota marmota]
MKGLYTDVEMKSDNVKDKDAKISFLQKAIDVVMMVSGEPLLAKPARIVAGHEPERTNELLQIIAKCCINKDRRNSEVKERSTSRDGKQRGELKEESKSREKERGKEKMKDNDRDRHKDAERDKYREGEKEQSRSRARQGRERDRDRGNKDRDADRDKERERRGEAGPEKERLRDRERDRDQGKDRERRRARNGEHSRDPDREKNREQEKLERKSASSGEISKKFSDGSFKDSKAETEAEISTTASRSLTSKTSKRRSKTSVEDDNSTTLWRESVEPDPAVKQKGDSISDAEGDTGATGQDKSEVCENPEAPSELSSSVRRIPRPGSARPAPPRVKRQEGVETLTMDRAGSGKTVSNVIIDSQNSDNEDDDQFVVEAAPQISEMSEIETVPALELEDSEKHGGLVKKILETKKDYEKLQQSPKPGEKEKSFVFESAWKKEKDIVSKEIEKLRVSIQTLCKSALPLGKIMDYIQEDVDAMQNELQLWHAENKQHAEALQKEQSITDCAVEPLKVELAELEQMIQDQQDKICAVKANILKNEEKIQKMVYSINLTSRR